MLASCGAASIAYDDVGVGLPVVFVHGFPHDRTLWLDGAGHLCNVERAAAFNHVLGEFLTTVAAA